MRSHYAVDLWERRSAKAHRRMVKRACAELLRRMANEKRERLPLDALCAKLCKSDTTWIHTNTKG